MDTFPTLSINPIYPLIRIPKFQTDVVSYGDAGEQRLIRMPQGKFDWKVVWYGLQIADKQLIQNFYLSQNGNAGLFYWGNPEDSQTYIVRFKEPEQDFELFSYKLWKLNTVEFMGG